MERLQERPVLRARGKLSMGKRIAVLGSTGSIGVNALDVIRRLNAGNGSYRVLGLSAFQNAALLKKQILEFRPQAAVLADERAAEDLRLWAVRNAPGLAVWSGTQGLERLAGQRDVDLVLSSVVGASGLLPLLAALRAGKKVALANKEPLVMAGALLTQEARKHGAEILPVDSEHSAIFQCLSAQDDRSVRRLILTASGGAFYRRKGSLDTVTVREALAHPTWKMGKKITVDCATLTNKGLEAIEAHHLFNVPLENIHIVIHPQSIVHSLVEFTDGAMLAQLSHPDMRLPIQYALTHPERKATPLRPLKLEEVQRLEFFRPDFRRFPCLRLALTAGRLGGTWPAVFNAVNEAAVRAFLQGRVSFMGIPWLLDKAMRMYKKYGRETTDENKNVGLEDFLKADLWGRETAEEILRRKNGIHY